MGERVTPVATLGIVGLGHMGGNMASRFLAAGYTVLGEARHREGARELERQGLEWRDTPRELAESAEVVLSSLPDDDVLEHVASGADGVLAGLSLKGDSYFYENPLVTSGRARWSWHNCPCCPPMFLKLMAGLPGDIYSTDANGL